MRQPAPKNIVSALAGNAYLVLIATQAGWACNAIVSRLAVGQASPMTIVFFRWLGVATLLLILARKDLIAHRPTLQKHWKRLLLMGVLAFTLYNSLFYNAAHHTTAVNIGILQGAVPALVFVVAFLFRGVRPTPLQLLGTLVTISGIVVIAAQGSLATLTTLSFNSGDVMMLVACLSWASYTVLLPSKPDVPPLAFFGTLALMAVTTSLPLFVAEIALGDFFWPTPEGIALMVFVTLVPSLFCQLCYVRGVELIGPVRAGLFLNLVPVFASVLAVVVLHETFHLFHAVALALVLGGITLSEWRQLRALRRNSGGASCSTGGT